MWHAPDPSSVLSSKRPNLVLNDLGAVQLRPNPIRMLGPINKRPVASMTLYDFLLIPFARDLVEIAGFAAVEGIVCYTLLRYLEARMRVRRPLV